MRGVFLFITGILVGMTIQPGWAQQGHIAGLNHVAVSVADYAGATNFYGRQMGFREAFSFREADGSPYLTYFQVNRDTFVEVMQATPERPDGCPHRGRIGSRRHRHRAARVRSAISSSKSHRVVEVSTR